MKIADPGFRVILAHLTMREQLTMLGRMLPDWPVELKDRHATIVAALQDANAAMWDLWTSEFEDDALILSEAKASSRLDGETHCVDAADATADTSGVLCHDFAPPPDSASCHDDPPSRPLPPAA